MCIGCNSVNQAQDLMSVRKFEDLPNSLIPNRHKLYDYFGAQKETHKAPYYGRNALEEPYLLITQGEISPVMTS